MSDDPPREFGKRRPQVVAKPMPPAKRSAHVALLLMGSFAVGGGAYALIPRGNCTGIAPSQPSQDGTNCTASGHSTGGGHGYWGGSSRASFFGGDFSSSRTGTSEAGGVTRGGFGSFAQAISAHFSRGG